MLLSSKPLHFARRDGGVALLVGVLLIGGLVLFGAGCKKAGPPPDAGQEVHDPNGAWRTYLPNGYELDPSAPLHIVELKHLSDSPIFASYFGVKERDVAPRLEGGAPLTMIVFLAPRGTPLEWYRPIVHQLQTSPATTSLADLPAWTFEDEGGLLPGTYVIGRRGKWAYEILLSGFERQTLLPLVEFMVGHLEST